MIVHSVSAKIRVWTQNRMQFQLFMVTLLVHFAFVGHLIIVIIIIFFFLNNDKSTTLSEFVY